MIFSKGGKAAKMSLRLNKISVVFGPECLRFFDKQFFFRNLQFKC